MITVDNMFYYVIYACLTCISILVIYVNNRRNLKPDKRACIVVLGDIGRSPRMQYHCLSMANHGFTVDFIGYKGAVPHKAILEHENIILHHIPTTPSMLQKLPRILVMMLKPIYQTLSLVYVLINCEKPSHTLMQNPPSIPTMLICVWMVWLQRTPLVIDWHNYGHTILALSLGKQHLFVKISKWYEETLGRCAARNICVTEAMKDDLKSYGITAEVMYDRPPEMFQSTTLENKHHLFTALSDKYPQFADGDGTIVTHLDDSNKIVPKSKRPAVVISSTSWTEDEDFSVLFNALDLYEKAIENDGSLPCLLCVITGKGPQKEYYQQQIALKHWRHITVITPWLEAEQYPVMLGSADIGVCLHTSSSGLDLPMKVVDMFGCGLPVCAIDFKCLHELVKHDVNGLVFHTADQLSLQLQTILRHFPHDNVKLAELRDNLKTFQGYRWEEAWNSCVAPIFR